MLSLLLFLSQASAVEVGGELQSNIRLSHSAEFFDFQDSLIFSPWWKAGEQVQALVDFDIRWHYPNTVTILEDTRFNEHLQPISFRANELWFRTQHNHHQIKIGYQQVLWGVASGISLLNSTNALDLRDPTRFDQRLSTPMIHLRSTYSAWSLELALLPWFTPAQLPEANIDVLPSAEEGFSINGEPLDIRSAEGRLTLPEPQLSNVQIASRIQYVHSFFDIFLSYNHCFDSLPQANGELLLTGFQTDQDRVDVGIPLIYPRLDIIGLGSTFRLPKDSIGWLEISYTMPQETSLIASQEQLDSLQILGVISDVPFPLPHTTTQDGAPYTKWILGVEHFFGPVLLNAQWLHGFVTERQQQDLNDYALLSSRWTIQPTIRLDSGAAFDGKGALLFTDLFFLIQDEIELGIGGFYTPTKEGSTFASYTELQHARLQANMKF